MTPESTARGGPAAGSEGSTGARGRGVGRRQDGDSRPWSGARGEFGEGMLAAELAGGAGWGRVTMAVDLVVADVRPSIIATPPRLDRRGFRLPAVVVQALGHQGGQGIHQG